jgi:hypothetical protein
LNFNVTSVVDNVTEITLTDESGDAVMSKVANTATAGLVQLGNSNVEHGVVTGADILRLNFTSADGGMALEGDVLFADIFTFGERNNNAIYRLLLDESGDNSGEFVGTVDFTMLNQLNIYSNSKFT